MTAADHPSSRPGGGPHASAHRTVEAVWRIESARLVAALTRKVRDIGLAEELAQEALVAALERWPQSGVPDNPGAWLMAVACRRAIDQFRRNARLERKVTELGRDLELRQHGAEDDLVDAVDDIGDDLLRLVFMACHPVLAAEGRVALTLRLLGGLRTDEIARTFLVAQATVAQRIVREKRSLAEKRVRFAVPRGDELADRLPSVLEVVYLIFNEGYAATAGEQWIRPQLCEEALRLGRIVAGLLPGEPEVHGLVALMELQASRLRARVGPGGEGILLGDQDRARWDRLLIRRGLAPSSAPRRSPACPAPTRCRRRSPPATHARARRKTPTGRASPSSTPRSPTGRHRPSSNSTAQSPSPWPPVPPTVWLSSTRWPGCPRCRATTCCRASAATCSRSSTVTTRREASSRGPRRSPATTANAPSCCSARPPPPMPIAPSAVGAGKTAATMSRRLPHRLDR